MTYLFLFIRRSMLDVGCSTFIVLFALSFCLMPQDCFATQWVKTYGGSASDTGGPLVFTTDGGYIVSGRTSSFGAGGYDFWILKFDTESNVSWQRAYGGWNGEYLLSIQPTNDGGCVIAGWETSFGEGVEDMWILKLDTGGSITWQKSFGGIEENRSTSIQQTRDGGYIVAGIFNVTTGVESSGDMIILKLDSGGNLTWPKSYGGSDKDNADSIQQTSDGGYIVAGYTKSFGAGEEDVWVLKLESDGDVSWQKTYGGSLDDRAHSIHQTNDGGYVVAGETFSYGAGGKDVWVLKLESDGDVSWQKTYGGNSNDSSSSIQQTIGGGYSMAGTTYSFPVGGPNMWILQLDPDGTISWQKTYGDAGVSKEEWANSIQQATDGGYIVVGRTNSFGAGNEDVLVLKLDSNGDINNCDSINETIVTGDGTNIISVADSTAIISTPSLTVVDTTAEVHETTAGVEELCFAPDWFLTETPTQDKLNGVWGYLSSLSNHEFYAVGEGGKIIHFDGTEWSSTGSPTMEDLYGIWGSSETDIFAVGDNSTIVRYNAGWVNVTHSLSSVTLYDVWGSSSSDLYAVGEGGFIAYYNGSAWSEVIHTLTTETLTSIWGSGTDNYVAVGEGGTILTYNGTSWTDATPDPALPDLSEVWGSASDNIYAVGTGGTIIHYDSTWSEIESPTSANLRGIWGSTENNIFAVGEHGTILYYDGVSWIKMDSGVQDSLVSTFGTLNPRVMVVGYDGNILSLGGPSVQGKICNACTGEGIDAVTVEFDKSLLGDEGVEYREEQTDADGIYPTIPSQGGPYPLLLTATDYLTKEITVDLPFNSSIVDHATYLLPDPGYQDCLSGTITKTVQIGTIPKENERGVQNIEVKLYQGSSERASTVTDVGGNYHFTGLSDGDYRVEPVIVGSECATTPETYPTIGIPMTQTCDETADPPWCSYSFELICPENPPVTGAYWQEMVSNTSSLLHGIWGSSGSNIFAVGDNGVIIKYDGNNWNAQTSETDNNLKGIWGSSETVVYAVGESGTVLKTINGGTTWTPMTSNAPYGLNAIWGSSASDIFAVGDRGTVIHGDGTSWTLMPSGTEVKLLGVWGNSGTDVYAVGNSHKEGYWKRTVIHYNGSTWEDVETGNGVTLMSSWGSSTSDITAAGSFGNIIHYDGIDWKQIGGPTEKTLNAMWGASGSNIFAVGFNGVIARYDGTEWSVWKTDQGDDLYGIWGETSPDIYAVAVGDRGKIYEYKGDIDNDGQADDEDNCINVSNPGQEDDDEDGLGDPCDNCPNDANEGQENSDYDDLGNACDNCPFITNEGQENGDEDSLGDVCDNCPNDTNEDQAETFPPQGNRCGDACECEGNFDGDEDVDGGDAATFKFDFGRSQFKNPCNTEPVCKGNFDCDMDVDGTDASNFKTDFGRSGFKNPCPSCPTEPWCVYP